MARLGTDLQSHILKMQLLFACANGAVIGIFGPAPLYSEQKGPPLALDRVSRVLV